MDIDKVRRAADRDTLAARFDTWRAAIDALLRGVSTNQGGEEVWTGPAADRFNGALRPVRRDVEKLPESFARTARNLRATAQRLRSGEPG